MFQSIAPASQEKETKLLFLTFIIDIGNKCWSAKLIQCNSKQNTNCTNLQSQHLFREYIELAVIFEHVRHIKIYTHHNKCFY